MNSEYGDAHQMTNMNITNISARQRVDVLWKPFDFLFPAGKLAKLVRIYDYLAKIPYDDILKKLKLNQAFPIVNLIGAKEVEINVEKTGKDGKKTIERVKDEKRTKFYAGIARAAFNCDAIVIDNAVPNGIEKYAMRRGVYLIGVAPENEIKFPKINPTQTDPNEIANGHTHLFLLNSPEEQLVWSQESLFKVDLCQELALKRKEIELYKEKCRQEDQDRDAQRKAGDKNDFPNDPKELEREKIKLDKERKNFIHRNLKCKIVHVLMGDSPNFEDEVVYAVKYDQPVIVVRGSEVCNQIAEVIEPSQTGEKKTLSFGDQRFKESLSKGKFFVIDSYDSEDIAQYIHFLLTVTPWDTPEDKEAIARAKKTIDRNNLYQQH